MFSFVSLFVFCVCVRIFCHHRLTQAWAYKYDDTLLSGISIHADAAAVNTNFWVTPNEANTDPNSGGLVVYKIKVPESVGYVVYNNDNAYTRQLLKSVNYENVTIPYRENRMVMFHSDLLHVTDRFKFKKGFRNRRINYTLLFGKMGEKCKK